jgi:hypothetical protein
MRNKRGPGGPRYSRPGGRRYGFIPLGRCGSRSSARNFAVYAPAEMLSPRMELIILLAQAV